AGTYTVSYSFAGDNTYGSSSASSKVKIVANTKTPTLTVKSTTTFGRGANTPFQVALTVDGVPLSGKTVTFTVNGKPYAKTTDSKGIASLPIGLAVGKYTISYANKADSEITSKSGSAKITVVTRNKTTLTWKSSASFNTGANTFSVLLKDSKNPISGATISLVVNSKEYTAKTSSNGYATFDMTLSKAGNYPVSFNFKGDNINAPSSGNKDITITSAKSISINDIVSGAATLKNYYASNGNLPSSVTAGGVKFTIPEFLYLMTQATYQLGNSNTKAITYITGIAAPSSISGDAINAQLLYKKDYLTVSKTIADDMKTNKKAPNYATTDLGNINYNALVDSFARIVAFYGSNDNTLPNYVTINAKAITPQQPEPTGKTISIKDIVSGADSLKKSFEKNNKLPSSVTAGGVKFTIPEFLYLMTQATYQLGNSNTKAIEYITGISAPSSISGDVINDLLYKKDYISLSNTIAKYIITNKKAPKYATTDLGKINYTELVDAFSRILAFYGSNDNTLPNYVTIKSSSESITPPVTGTGSGLNEPCTVSDLTPYLKSSTNCQVNNSEIKSLVNSLISGLTSDYDKAKAIYNYVRDAISYSFYYDTRYGAVGTLHAKTGNCVDQSHLLIAMFRTAGLASRYVHGSNCQFSSGTYGHVWTQVLIGNNWVVADATSARNSFGTIVNWNTNSFYLNGIYSGISF
ncbi:transglutaminase domain-containing protein, partial [Methanobrevibacter sp.]|uniref:transglutaminase domain-containing protein n=1 Tax=Methanobrevibacter sp. TaxID=66852 RepID=UPI00388E89D8